MRRAINSAAVARLAGVSRTTVSFVLNRRDDAAGIPAATRDRVLRAAEELGYQPNHLARALLTGRSYLIRLLVQRVHPAFYSRATEAFHATLRGSGYDLHIQETLDWTPEEWENAAAGRWPADGILVFEQGTFVPYLVEGLKGRIPIVNVGPAPVKSIPHVGVDLYTGTTEAVRHLIETGRTRIGYLGWDFVAEQSAHHPRGAAYATEMQKRGLPPRWITATWDPHYRDRVFGQRAMDEYLAAGDPYKLDAVVCFNDEMAVSALQSLKRHGRRVPEDVALVGCDGIEETEYHDPPLSTLRFPYEEAAQVAWEILRHGIEAQEEHTEQETTPPVSRLLLPQLIVRESSRPSPTGGS
jgi:LacI family transcriptional regulator